MERFVGTTSGEGGAWIPKGKSEQRKGISGLENSNVHPKIPVPGCLSGGVAGNAHRKGEGGNTKMHRGGETVAQLKRAEEGSAVAQL